MLNFKIPGPDLGEMRRKFESLPGVIDALTKVPQALRDMPPAPVVVGAASRMIANLIAGELECRGPSSGFRAACADLNLTDDAAVDALHSALVAEIRL